MITRLRHIWRYFCAALIGGLSVLAVLAFYTDGHLGELFHFLRVYRLVESNYFRTLDESSMWQGASQGMLDSLNDRYSSLVTGDDYTKLITYTRGDYSGIGVILGEDKSSRIRIYTVIKGSNAEKAGLKAGDEILSVDGISSSELKITDLAQRVRGQAGTSVTLEIERDDKTLSFNVTRSQISLPTLSSRMITSEIGYIHIFTFGGHTSDEFNSELESLKNQGCKKLIIDLRMNPGGLVESAINIADQLITKGIVVSYNTKSLGNKVYSVNGIEHPMPMVVLIDRNSASAAEILAGAIQDRQEGTIIGEKSFGKGTVQAVYFQDNESAVRISIAEYKLPSGRTIDKTGIIPDIKVVQSGYPFDTSTDNVLQKGIDVLQQK